MKKEITKMIITGILGVVVSSYIGIGSFLVKADNREDIGKSEVTIGTAIETASEIASEIPIETVPEVIQMQEGQKLQNPWKGKVEISDKEVLEMSKDGYLESKKEGEAEVVIRYRVKVEKAANKEVVEKKENVPNIENPEKEENVSKEELKEELKEESKEEVIVIAPTDSTYPVITLANVKPISANARTVAPSICVEDKNLKGDSVVITLVGKMQGVLKPKSKVTKESDKMQIELDEIKVDDEYVMTAKGEDSSGNRTTQTWVFTVNQKGTEFIYDTSKANTVCEKEFIPNVQIKNLDELAIVTCAVNGIETPCNLENGELLINQEAFCVGKNRITVTTRDGAGNLSTMEPWEFVVEEEEGEKAAVSFDGNPKETKKKESTVGSVLLLMGGTLALYARKHTVKSNGRKFESPR